MTPEDRLRVFGLASPRHGTYHEVFDEAGEMLIDSFGYATPTGSARALEQDRIRAELAPLTHAIRVEEMRRRK